MHLRAQLWPKLNRNGARLAALFFVFLPFPVPGLVNVYSWVVMVRDGIKGFDGAWGLKICGLPCHISQAALTLHIENLEISPFDNPIQDLETAPFPWSMILSFRQSPPDLFFG